MAGRWRVATVSMAFTILPACIYWLAGMTGTITIGTLVAFTSMQNRLVSPVAQLLGVTLGLAGSLAVFARIFEALDLPVDIAPGTRTLYEPRGDVELNGVWFRYGENWTLQGVDLTIPAGTHVAVAGETGAGKTTLAYLVARLYEAARGSVLVDGVDVRERKARDPVDDRRDHGQHRAARGQDPLAAQVVHDALADQVGQPRGPDAERRGGGSREQHAPGQPADQRGAAFRAARGRRSRAAGTGR